MVLETAVLAEPTSSQYAFDQATDSYHIGRSASGADIYAGRVNPTWAIGQVPVRGYVIALSLHAVLDYYSTRHQKHPVALNTFFFKKTEPGPFIVEISDLKPSKKGFHVVKVLLRQHKKDGSAKKVPESLEEYNPAEYVTKTHSIITMGNMDGEKGVTYIHPTEGAKPPSLELMKPTQMEFIKEYVNVYQDQSTLPIHKQDGQIISGRPEVHHCVSFKDGRESDFKSLPFWADVFVHPVFSLGEQVLGGRCWMPTLQLEVQFKAVPKNVKSVLASFKVPHIINGRFDLDGALFDQHQNLLAITRHQCLVVPWERNTPPKL
ncbi:thioesterase-like superfamily-domain-containing protein [Fennellomyces sp. T-0311]|nr:thioesterase-like superfamily-domain-containing protein [Fennellomyces sp. T-0311]